MTIEFVKQSPIEKVSATEAKKAAKTLSDSISDWGGTGEAGWDKRIGDTTEIAAKLIKDRGDPYDEGYIYKVSGAVVGVMVLSEDLSSMHVKFLVTHPGTQKAGGILIEKAVERSLEEGYNGSLELISHSPESTDAYTALGFVALGENQRASHRLDPAKRAEWDTTGKPYRLKKYKDKGFAV